MIKQFKTVYVSPVVKTVEIGPRAIMQNSPEGMLLCEKDLGGSGLREEE